MSESGFVRMLKGAMWPPEPYAISDEIDTARYVGGGEGSTKRGVVPERLKIFTTLRFPDAFNTHRVVVKDTLSRIPSRYHRLDAYAPAVIDVLDAFAREGVDVKDSCVSLGVVKMMADAIEHPKFLWREIVTFRAIRRVDIEDIDMDELRDMSRAVGNAVKGMRGLVKPPEEEVFLQLVAMAYASDLGRHYSQHRGGGLRKPAPTTNLSRMTSKRFRFNSVLARRALRRG